MVKLFSLLGACRGIKSFHKYTAPLPPLPSIRRNRYPGWGRRTQGGRGLDEVRGTGEGIHGGWAGNTRACQSCCAPLGLNFLICKMGAFLPQGLHDLRSACTLLPFVSPRAAGRSQTVSPGGSTQSPKRGAWGQSDRPAPAPHAAEPRVSAANPSLPGSAELRRPGGAARAFTPVALCGCRPALMPREPRGPLSEAAHK